MLLEVDLGAKAKWQTFHDLNQARWWSYHVEAPHQTAQMNRAGLFPRSRRLLLSTKSISMVSVHFLSCRHHLYVPVGLEAVATSIPNELLLLPIRDSQHSRGAQVAIVPMMLAPHSN